MDLCGESGMGHLTGYLLLNLKCGIHKLSWRCSISGVGCPVAMNLPGEK
jgi:hypothetical protein